MLNIDKTQAMDYNRIIDFLILKSFTISNKGLLNGRMGITLAFYYIGNAENNDNYIRFGNRLLDSIIGNLDATVPKNFADGLCGIGWGIEYLLHHEFVECSSYNLLGELNECIEHEEIEEWEMSLDYGLEGLLHYILAHIKNNAGNGVINFSHSFLKKLYDRLCSICLHKESTLQELSQLYMNWYIHGELDYKFDLEKFIHIESFFNIPLNNQSISLSNGLAGYIIKFRRVEE